MGNQIRSDGSRDDQAGEAGLVEQSSAEAKSLKLRAKGLSGCHPIHFSIFSIIFPYFQYIFLYF